MKSHIEPQERAGRRAKAHVKKIGTEAEGFGLARL